MIPAKKFINLDRNTTLHEDSFDACANNSIDPMNKNETITQDQIDNPFDLPQLANHSQTIDLDDGKAKAKSQLREI